MDKESAAKNLSCSAAEKRMHQLLDDRLTLIEDRILIAHASACADCDQMIRDYEIFVGDFSPGNRRFVEYCQTDAISTTRGNRLGRRQLGVLTSLAAILILSFGLFSISLNSLSVSDSVSQLRSTLPAETLAFAVNRPADQPDSQSDQSPQHVESEEDRFVHRLVFFQPPTLFELAQTTPTWVDTLRQPRRSSWEQITDQLDPLSPYLQISAELPGVRNFHNSVHVTLNLLHQSFFKPAESQPDLGFFAKDDFFAAI